jgi:hypothetical protein
MKKEYELHIKGFKTKAQAKAFAEWYESQGEQDSSIWFQFRKDSGEIDVDFMGVDCSRELEWKENILTMHLAIS